MKKRYWISGGVILLAAALVLAYFFAWRGGQPKKVNEAVKTPTPAASAPALDPLAIEAIRARSYPGSAITVEQNIGSKGGHSSAVVSYSSEGNKIYALMSTPAGSAPAGGWPVIVLDHGYINPVDYQTTGDDHQFTANRSALINNVLTFYRQNL